jgi:hypothetical protein
MEKCVPCSLRRRGGAATLRLPLRVLHVALPEYRVARRIGISRPLSPVGVGRASSGGGAGMTSWSGPSKTCYPRWSAIANPSLIGSSQRSRSGLGRNRPCRHTDDRRGWLDILGNHGTSAHNRPIADM